MYRVDIEGLEELEALFRAHQAATAELEATGNTAVTRMLAFISRRLADRWADRAPYLTGTLASATRSQVFEGVGRVFIDPTVENPVFGGRPAIYGPYQNRLQGWVDDVYYTDAPPILTEAGTTFFAEIDNEYRRELG